MEDHAVKEIKGDQAAAPAPQVPKVPREQYELKVRFFLDGQPVPNMYKGKGGVLCNFRERGAVKEQELSPKLIKVGSSSVDTYSRLKTILANFPPEIDPNIPDAALINVKFHKIKLNVKIQTDGTTFHELDLAHADGSGIKTSAEDNDGWNRLFARLTSDHRAGIHVHYLSFIPKIENTVRYYEPWTF